LYLTRHVTQPLVLATQKLFIIYFLYHITYHYYIESNTKWLLIGKE
jgi:putative effector of murein hydrolase